MSGKPVGIWTPVTDETDAIEWLHEHYATVVLSPEGCDVYAPLAHAHDLTLVGATRKVQAILFRDRSKIIFPGPRGERADGSVPQ